MINLIDYEFLIQRSSCYIVDFLIEDVQGEYSERFPNSFERFKIPSNMSLGNHQKFFGNSFGNLQKFSRKFLRILKEICRESLGNPHKLRNTLGGGGQRFVTNLFKSIGIYTVFCYVGEGRYENLKNNVTYVRKSLEILKEIFRKCLGILQEIFLKSVGILCPESGKIALYLLTKLSISPSRYEKNQMLNKVPFSTQICSLYAIFRCNEQIWVLNGTLIST